MRPVKGPKTRPETERSKCRGGPPARPPASAARAWLRAIDFTIAWLAFGVAGGPEGCPYTTRTVPSSQW